MLAFPIEHSAHHFPFLTRRVIASRTTIPIPRVIAYALGDGPEPPLSSFLILEFVEGQTLDLRKLDELPEEHLTNLYASLADIYIQLRRLELPSIGCLGSGPGPGDIQVDKKTMSIDINMQELEGLQPSKIQSSYYEHDPDGRLTTANKYVEMLLDIADNAFAKGRGSVLDEDMGGDALYHLHLFREFAQEWVDPNLNQGPFVIVHGDLEAFNLLLIRICRLSPFRIGSGVAWYLDSSLSPPCGSESLAPLCFPTRFSTRDISTNSTVC